MNREKFLNILMGQDGWASNMSIHADFIADALEVAGLAPWKQPPKTDHELDRDRLRVDRERMRQALQGYGSRSGYVQLVVDVRNFNKAVAILESADGAFRVDIDQAMSSASGTIASLAEDLYRSTTSEAVAQDRLNAAQAEIDRLRESLKDLVSMAGCYHPSSCAAHRESSDLACDCSWKEPWLAAIQAIAQEGKTP